MAITYHSGNRLQGTSTGIVSGYDLSNASYDNVSFSVSSQDTVPTGLAFNSDGTKMYVVGLGNDKVHQYSLSTAFNIGTASYNSVSFSVSGQESSPQGLVFNSDGTKMYVVGSTNDTVYQYSLSTGFDLSTASYDSVSFSVSSQDTVPTGLAFNSDGTKMYVVGYINDTVYQYSLSTGFDLSTASYDSVSFSVSSQESSPQGLAFNSDGTKMYVVGYDGDTVYQYSLSTAFNVGTASYNSVSFSVSGQESSLHGLAFNSDGTKMYVVGDVNDTVYQYSTSSTSSDYNNATNVPLYSRFEETDTRKMYNFTEPTDFDYSNLKTHYDFEQTSGNLTNVATSTGSSDSLGSSADLTASNISYSQTGKIGSYSWGFNGSSSHAQGGNLGNIPTKFTFAVWFKQDTLSNYQGLFSTHDPNSYGTNNIGVRVECNSSGSLDVIVGNDSNGGATYTGKNAGSISAGEWYFLVIKGDTSANTLELTLNDTTNSYTGLSGYWSTTFPDLCIGTGYNTSRRFDGLVDSFSYWDKHLTSDEISALYNSGTGQPLASAKVPATNYWKEIGT